MIDSKETSVALTDRELALVQKVADERGLSLEDAATELFKEAVAQRFRKVVGRGPAKVYPIPAPRKVVH